MGNKNADKYPFGLSRRLYRLNVGMTLALVVIVAATAAVLWIRAADVSSMKDTLSNQSTNGTATHRISFILSGGNSFASGEVIAVDFPASFGASGDGTWAVSDFAFDDGTARTVDAVNDGPGVSTVACTDGANNVGIAIDTTALVFRAIPCGGSFTASAAGATVLLTIYGATPNGWISNPASAGSHVLTITDAAGECGAGDCKMAVAIVDTTNVTVSATVQSICGNSIIEWGESCDDGNVVSGDGCSATCQTEGGGPPPPGDTTPPAISNIRATDITTTAANIQWDTNESSTSLVRYGLTAAYGSTATSSGYVMAHTVPLSGLTEATTYHYQVCSTDSANNQACSSDQTFSTLDETPPIISNVQVINITGTTATITWTTNEDADSKVDYGLAAGPPYASTQTDAAMVTSHSITVTGLTPGTTYHYRVRSGDASSNEAFTIDAVFSTADGDAPVISNIRVTDITADSAIVRWDTDEASDSEVDYGLPAGPPYANTETVGTMVIAHAVPLTGLTSSTLYHYRVRSADASLNEAVSGDLTFTTADTTPPIISNIQITNITDTSVRITWTTDENSDSTVNYGLIAGPPYASTQTSAAMVTSHTIDITGLTPNTTYHFNIASKDIGNNEAVSADLNFTTALPPPPVISNIRVENITENSARVLWDTTTSSNSATDYGTTIAYGSTGTNATMTINHLVVLNGLLTGTTYHYLVRSTDAYGQEAVSGDQTFSTLADTTPPANVTGFTATSGNSQVTLTWTNPTDADFAGVIVVRKQGGFPTGPTDGTTVYTGTGTSQVDLGRTNGVTYYYAIYAYDEVPNYSSGSLASATPTGPADIIPPGNVTGFTATPGNMQVMLTWTNPTDADFAGVRIVRGPAGGACPIGPMDGTIVYEGTGTSQLDVGLTNGVTYCYAAFAFDAIPNYSSGVTASATPTAPVDVTPPADVTNFAAIAGDAQVQLNWTNPADADWTGTVIVRKTGGFPTGPADGIVVFDGAGNTVNDLGLTNGTTYYYAAFAYDGSSNYSSGAFAQATPSAGAPPLPPPLCTDTDGGRSYLVRGTVTTPLISFIDVCTERTVLQEYYCDAAAYASEVHDCGLGYRCSAGRCTPDTFVPPTTICGNGICESRDCDVDCSLMTYDLYIVNPDASEHHIGSGNVRETIIEPGVRELAYEDNSGAFDYNDVVMRLDTRDCRNVVVSLVSHNGTRNHEVRLEVSYDGTPKFDDYVWQDLLVPVGSIWTKNAAADPTICVGNENPLNCPDDCVVKPPTPPIIEEEPTVSEEERLSMLDLLFLVTKARMPLVVQDDTVEVFPATNVVINLPEESIVKPIKRAFVNFTDSSYAMQPAEGFEAAVGTPATVGDYPVTIIVEYEDGTNDYIHGTIRIVPFGRVIDESGEGLPGARVTLYVDLGGGNFGLWDGTPYGMSNPQMSREDGIYGFIVPPRTYRLNAEMDGFRTKETMAFPIGNNLVSRDLLLISSPEDTFADIIDILVDTDDLSDAIGDAAGVVVDEVIYGAESAVEDITEFIQNEDVEQQSQGAAPAVIAVAAANVAVAGATTATAIPYLIYLYSLLTHPSILFLGRRRKKWGVVYDAITKRPVDLAIVRLVNDKTGKILRSMVTDKDGRYFFVVEPGSYRMTVAKSGFIFPTVYLEGDKEDARFVDLYHGETIHVTQNTAVTANIPIDPVAAEKTPRRILWEGIGQRAQKSISLLTLIAMGGAFIISPTPIIGALFGANIALYFVFRRFAAGRRPKSWGIVYDDETRRPLRNAVVRIFEAKYNKLLETKITDMRGRYAFLVGNNVYYVTFEKPGYRKRQEGPLDLIQIKKEEDQLIAENVGLVPEKPKNFAGSLKARFRSLFSPLSREVASVSKPPLVEASKEKLIVGPGEEAPKYEREAQEEAVPEEKPKEEGKRVPWELEMLEKAGAVEPEEGTEGNEQGTEASETKASAEQMAPWEEQSIGSDLGIGSLGARLPEEKPVGEIAKTAESAPVDEVRGEEAAEEPAVQPDEASGAPAESVQTEEATKVEEPSWADQELERLKKEAEAPDAGGTAGEPSSQSGAASFTNDIGGEAGKDT